ncbi:MAG: cyclophilin-like fold protein [Rhizobium sp.]|nr:cyclophilin-like fold protein [Rhizobium sp.]
MNGDHRLTRRTPLVTGALCLILARSTHAQERNLMKIRFSFSDQDFTATLYDNVSARDFASMLPLDIEVSDYSTNEKIAYLPRKLNPEARGPFPNPAIGDICYYVPWGNLVLYHGDYSSIRDLVRLGRIDGGVEPILTRGTYPMRITRIS